MPKNLQVLPCSEPHPSPWFHVNSCARFLHNPCGKNNNKPKQYLTNKQKQKKGTNTISLAK